MWARWRHDPFKMLLHLITFMHIIMRTPKPICIIQKMVAYMKGGTWSSLPPQPWSHGHALFYETNATHAFTHLLNTFIRVHFFWLQIPSLLPTMECIAFPWLGQSRVWNGFKNLLLKTFWWCGSTNSCTFTKPLLLSLITLYRLDHVGRNFLSNQ